ncbi:MAG: hypothetical protein JWN63_1007 [Candidatus Acidoferrum typicum]|nr:hypothetical protein [Candidatus Acidoferrum typicum]
MFLEFYRLRDQPFGVTPDPCFIYPSRTHSKAFNSLSRGIEAGCGFLALIAKPGMGKTTLVFQLLKELEETSSVVFLFQTQSDSREFLRFLLSGLGLNAAGLDIVGMHERLNQVLARELLAGRHFVLIIDECQNLDSSVLETVRLLSDFETPKTKLMQIVLVGQPQLTVKLSSSSLAQLRQRISVLCHLDPLTREEIVRYIDHRLRVAGYSGAPLFTAGALEKTHSEGIPRNINNLCFNALLTGRKQIDSAIVDRVVADLEMNPLEPQGAVTQQELPALTSARTIYPGFDLSGIHPGIIKTDRNASDSTGVEKLVAEIDAPYSPPNPDVPQVHVPTPLQRTQAPHVKAVGHGFSGSKVDSRNAHKRASDFGADSPARKLNVTQPLGPPQGAQTDSSTVHRDFSGRKQHPSSGVDIPYLAASGGALAAGPGAS